MLLLEFLIPIDINCKNLLMAKFIFCYSINVEINTDCGGYYVSEK